MQHKGSQLLFLPFFFYRSEGGDEDNIPTKGVVGEAVHNVKVKNVESRDVLGPLPQFHQSVL